LTPAPEAAAGFFCAVTGRDPLEKSLTRDGIRLAKMLDRSTPAQGQVAPVSCFRPVMSCYPRAAAVTPNASEAAPISYFHPVGYGGNADAGLYPRVLFLPVIYRERSSAKTGDRTTLELLLQKYSLKHCEPTVWSY
jgi:hypothetical protein